MPDDVIRLVLPVLHDIVPRPIAVRTDVRRTALRDVDPKAPDTQSRHDGMLPPIAVRPRLPTADGLAAGSEEASRIPEIRAPARQEFIDC